MKKLLMVCSFVVLLPGCALWDIYNQTKYDTNEYALITEIRTLAQTSKGCDAESVKKIYVATQQLNNFSEYLPGNNKKTVEMNTGLMNMVKELYNKPQPIAPMYCNAKLNIIEITAESIQKVTGTKPR
jgi:hypothetical protein